MKSNIDRTIREAFASRAQPGNLRFISEAFWRCLLLVSLFAVFMIIGFGWWEFSMIMKKISAENTGNASPQTDALDREALDQLLLDHAAQKAEYEFAKKNRPASIDPSR